MKSVAERMPHELSHIGFRASPIVRLITISTPPVIACDSFEFFFQAEDGIRAVLGSRGLGDVYKRQDYSGI